MGHVTGNGAVGSVRRRHHRRHAGRFADAHPSILSITGGSSTKVMIRIGARHFGHRTGRHS